jgi:hypothetical protein
MTNRLFRRSNSPPVVMLDRIRPVEVPILTEVKRRLGRNDVAGALLLAYPKVVEDLGRAYGVEFPEGYSHEEILEKRFNAEMRPMAEFFDRLYRLYAPVRFGKRPNPGSGDLVLELMQSLYSAQPMWHLYVTTLPSGAPGNGSTAAEAAPPPTDAPKDG